MLLPGWAALPVPVIRSLVTRWVGGGPCGTVMTGLVERSEGILGVVGVEAWVGPSDGAVWTPGAFELPQAVRPAPRAQTDRMVSDHFLIGRRLARTTPGRPQPA